MFSLDQYKDAMKVVSVPLTADDVSLTRDRFLDAREAVQQAEAAIHAAQGQRGANLEPLYRQLEVAKDGLLEAQAQFQRIGQYGTSLEAQAFANQQRKTQELEAKKQEEAQLKANEAEKAAYKEELWPGYLAAGYTRAEFDAHFAEPVHGLWAQRVTERKAQRDREMATSWRDRYATMHL